MNNPTVNDELKIVFEDHEEDYHAVCSNLYQYNLR
jgi:hypothetical protein